MLHLGQYGVKATGQEDSGQAFANLSCKKIYLWGDQSAPKRSQKFIKSAKLSNYCFKDCGHSPMIDDPEKFYNIVKDFLAK